jgi:predicted RNase H-like nuclease (RuvC/YqgF family)
MRNVVVFKQYNSSADDSHLSLLSIDQIAHAIRTMKNKLSAVMNKLTKLKIENIQLLKRVKELKLSTIMNKLTKLKIENKQLLKRIEDLKSKNEDKNLKNVDKIIDFLERNFDDEAISLT